MRLSRFLVLYRFHSADNLSLSRLQRLAAMNPDVTFVPMFGVKQLVYIPMLVDFRNVPAVRYIWNTVNKMALQSSDLFALSYAINRELGEFTYRSRIEGLRKMLDDLQLSLYCDYTPMVLGLNSDLAILNWFKSAGGGVSFDFLINYEYDTYTTRKIQTLYGQYASFDAAFAEYRQAMSDWFYWRYPPGARRSVLSWLNMKGAKPVLYRSLFSGSMISRKALEVLCETDLPFCHCEMRTPTVLSALGFTCTRLDFPKLRYRPAVTRAEIEKEEEAGIFHPVYEPIDQFEKGQ